MTNSVEPTTLPWQKAIFVCEAFLLDQWKHGKNNINVQYSIKVCMGSSTKTYRENGPLYSSKEVGWSKLWDSSQYRGQMINKCSLCHYSSKLCIIEPSESLSRSMTNSVEPTIPPWQKALFVNWALLVGSVETLQKQYQCPIFDQGLHGQINKNLPWKWSTVFV